MSVFVTQPLTEGINFSFFAQLIKFFFFCFLLSSSSLFLSTFLTFCLFFCYPLAHSTTISSNTAFGFLFSDKCGFSTERLVLNKQRDTVENVAGMAFLLAADRVQTGSYIGLDYIIGDTGISQGRYAKNTLLSGTFCKEFVFASRVLFSGSHKRHKQCNT